MKLPSFRQLLSWRRVALTAILGGITAVATVVASESWIHARAEGHLYSIEAVPAAPVALVLGTQVLRTGEPGEFLAGRLETARQLYTTGKVRAILVSGDNGRRGYDEPTAMYSWLVRNGVPAEHVVRDYAGFDTYDSCFRAKRIFGVDRAIVVTQSFHIARSVALCRELGIDTDGVGDETVRGVQPMVWRNASTREHLAHVKAVLDLISGRDPVHLGRVETGVADALS
ncbi:SanA/YdcF family protein [Catenuloplanes atrovinosus]|uniref:Vancomycin permeability regulator SanA n=1 Tax=Catenuloplanes atrovinosus TaxID=137266 RepID=A0AAE3YKF4_9ACTN|nr:ElyC/SanA/YdcF family protein [Catenuloplanes atrovinosus]MDR7274044.1 vancomycin permeability regulator SanA [Catenuloplanes atrovinosus]